MNAIVNHKTISFYWPFGPRDSGPVRKPIIPHLRRYQGFAVVHYSITLDALYLGHPRLSLNRGLKLPTSSPSRQKTNNSEACRKLYH